MSITFNDAKVKVRQLVKEKGFPNDKAALTQKLLWAFVELGEASDAYKKGEPWEKVAEECIDVFFYVLDFLGLAEQECGEHFDLDKIFYEKWKKNMSRPAQYGQKRDIK
jgi:NTP pyrophosphatase (non-canonical NTP hydrolase)